MGEKKTGRFAQVGKAGGPLEMVTRELGAAHYIDNTAQNVAAGLKMLGGAETILATVADADAMSVALGGLGHEGKLVVLGAAGLR